MQAVPSNGSFQLEDVGEGVGDGIEVFAGAGNEFGIIDVRAASNFA